MLYNVCDVLSYIFPSIRMIYPESLHVTTPDKQMGHST